MRKSYEAMVDLDMLTPPRDYIGSTLDTLCARLGYTAGLAVEETADGQTILLAAYQVPACQIDALIAVPAARMPNRHTRSAHARHVIITVPPVADTRHAGNAFYAAEQIAMIVTVPLWYKGQRLGYINLYANSMWALAESEQQMLTQVGEMLAVSLASSRVLDQLHHRTCELQTQVSERSRAESALRDALRERKELEGIVNRSPMVAILWRPTPDGCVEYVSRNITQFGYAPDELLAGKVCFYDLVHPDDGKRVRGEVERCLADGEHEFTLEYRIPTKAGDIRWVENRILVRRDTDGTDLLYVVTPPQGTVTHLQGIMHDITQRKRAEETVRHQAYHDMLTDLPNRTLFQDRLTLALAQARRYHTQLAVMFLDLDRFKMINDTLGHATGDQILQQVAARLRTLLREEDTIARLGGDEFTVLLPKVTSADDAAFVAAKILNALRPPFQCGEHELYISTSIGISMFPKDGKDAQMLLQNADTALYHAKEHGRDTLQFYSPRMYKKTLERLELENELRHALECGHFSIHYQPQVEINSGQLVGMEALLRWNHPQRGLLTTEQFLSVAEESGLMVPIGQWVLQHACAQARAWRDAGYPALTLSVNLSSRQFQHDHLLETVRTVLDETGFPACDLVLDIGESTAMHHVQHGIVLMRKLTALGINLALDDFGTGFSSLIYLKKFPISTLKLDHSIVTGLTREPSDEAIATAIITLARQLHLQVIAEGVETEEQQAFLRRCGCSGMQGYLYSKPLPVDAFEQLLRFLVI